jgi:zinc protease
MMVNPVLRLRPAIALSLMAIIAAVPSPVGAQERFRRTPPLADAQPLELHLPALERIKLSNGLSVVTAYRPDSPLITLQLVIRAGEVDSPPDLPAVAALTARMIGKGTKLLSADYIENMLESIGADFSVTVLMDYTVLTMHLLEEFLDRALFAMRLMVLEPAFSERELVAVRRTAYWELFEQKKDPEFLAWKQLLRALFENNPYRIATYTEDVIKYVSSKDVAAFYSRFYRPDNSVFLVSGNLTGDTAARKVSLHFNTWVPQPVGRDPVPPPAPNTSDRICFIVDPSSKDATIFVGNVIMDAFDPDFFPFLVLKQVLGGTTQSHLFMNLRESKGYAYYAFSETEFFRTCGVFWARARVTPEAIVPAVREIEREIRALSTDAISPAEIEEAKSYLIGNLPMRFESVEGFADWMARFVALDLDLGQWDRMPERLKLVNVERTRATALKYLAAKPLVIIVGDPDWLIHHLVDFDTVEVYDTAGTLQQTLRKGELK